MIAGVQYPQYPFYNAAPNYYYENSPNSRGENYYSPPIDEEDAYTSSSGSSGYGNTAPSGYGAAHYPSSDHPTGPSATGHSAPAVHPPPPAKSFFPIFKKGGSSTMSALTLLSFFFFVNVLQQCIKEHMADTNPTVMVMSDKLLNKIDNDKEVVEINARERNSSPASTSSTHEEIVEAGGAVESSFAPAATISATLKKPTSENVPIINSIHNKNSNPISADQPDSYDDSNSYRNRTENPSSPNTHPDRYRPQHYYDDEYGSPYHRDSYPWSHHSTRSHYRHRFHDPYSSYWDEYEASRFPNHDTFDDPSFLRIY